MNQVRETIERIQSQISRQHLNSDSFDRSYFSPLQSHQTQRI